MFGCQLCFKIHVFYVPDAIYYVPAKAARTAGTARTTPTLQNDRKFKFEEQKGVFVNFSG